ncbi:hypothetical protein FisN_24Hh141 [Fistulifera solaris]|uniref:Peptidase M50B-like n=1 Tax=Fistulifera solaris TaxID=1519565 RepID=A0A1Z5JUS9_FISSO|nr:hypothetical protein FisN_24Hh141 [Fistulifera solaris]|eukprot:GAX17790.1 hypothetical protein FisN_24Hh141 [Fistulifera solaris]
MSIDWELENCCGDEERLFLIFYGIYVIVFVVLFRTFLMKPMNVLSVFVHEFGHASACVVTGGKLDAIEVYQNEGGVTKYKGGCQCLVIPAGYVGSAFWGGAFVAMSGNRIGATVVAAMITGALLFSLCYKPNSTMVMISLGFSALNAVAVFIEWFVFDPFLEYITLFYGVYIGYYAVRDIYDDLITRTADGSDAVACSKLFRCCHPRCVGVQFWLVAFAFQALGLYLALVWRATVEN